MPSEILAHVIRGETIESIHRGHIFIVDGEGNTVASVGDPSTVTYFRSASKPFQSMPLITSGAADAFGFTDDEIAMAVASHSGEKMHVDRVAKMLEKISLTESDLRCGAHAPFYTKEAERMIREGETPTQLHNNCSGKHAAMLALAKHIGADIGSYDLPESRVQKRILRCVSDFTSVAENDIAIGIDGCCVPNFAVSIAAMAKSFANLVFPLNFHPAVQEAASRITHAMMRHPELIGGTERLDTMLMQAAPGKIISKVGADGVWLCGILPSEKYPNGLGIALKVEDGDDHRGRPVIAVDILRQLGILGADDLTDLTASMIKNRRGEIVGRIEAHQSFLADVNIT
ncbi:MAG: asparaginase [Pyrinomonadaceae bacterium]